MSGHEELPDDFDDFEGGRRRGRGRARAGEAAGVVLDEKLNRLPRSARAKMARIVTVDIEAYEWVHPYAVGLHDGRTFVAFESRVGMPEHRARKGKGKRNATEEKDCIELFLDHFLTEAYLGVTAYAHNGGNYDFIPMFGKFFTSSLYTKRGFRFNCAQVGSNMFKMVVTHPAHEGRWLFLDSTRILPMSLEKVGETFNLGGKTDVGRALGLPKGTTSETLYRELARPKNRAVMLRYLKQDCVLLYRGVKAFSDIIEREGGQLKSTIAATAKDVFHRAHLRADVYVNRHFHTCPDLGKDKVTCPGCGHLYIRQAYKGGRAEILTMKGSNLFYFDKNSHYGDVMRAAMPIGIASVIEGGDEATVYRNARRQVGIVDCEVEIPDDCYLPPLPYKHDRTGKLIFPVGSFRGVWDTCELELLPLVGGRITKVHRQAWMEAGPVFSEYVEHFYAYRNRASKHWTLGMDTVAKNLITNLYGKYGQREIQEEIIINPTEEQFSRGLTRIGTDMRFDAWAGTTQNKADHICPQLAVHVTSLGRARWWRDVMAMREKGATLYYGDTDSIVVSFPSGAPAWPSSGQMGHWKLEHVIKSAAFELPKLYMVECAPDCPCSRPGTKLRMKGFGPGLGQTPTLADYKRLIARELAPEDRGVRRRRIAKICESMSSYVRKGLPFFHVVEQAKKINTVYDKRVVLDDGCATRPLILPRELSTIDA